METCRRHRRRGKGFRRKHKVAVENLQPGHRSLGIGSENATPSHHRIIDFEFNSDTSDSLEAGDMESIAVAEMPAQARSRILAHHEPSQSHSPKPKSLLTTSADTPMLGAQARAAELAAASAAKQRQVSREREERQLPPNPAISLSAFTKPQSIQSRNKGAKNWKPLTLDDIVESSANTSTFRNVSSPSGEPECFQIPEFTEKTIPTAPRAMMAGRSLSTVTAHALLAEGKSTGDRLQHAGIPLNNVIRNQKYGSTIPPQDTSPSKQEEDSFFMLGNVSLPQSIPTRENAQLLMPQYPNIQPDDEFPCRMTPHPGQNQKHMWEPPGCKTYCQGLHSSIPSHAGSDKKFHNTEPDGRHSIVGDIKGSLKGIDPTASKQDPPANRLPLLTSCQGSAPETQPHSTLGHQELYDTEKAMKECVNKLRATARDGKTVLHNPFTRMKTPCRGGSEFEPLHDADLGGISYGQLTVPWAVQSKDFMKTTEQEAGPSENNLTLTQVQPSGRGQNAYAANRPAPDHEFRCTLRSSNLLRSSESRPTEPSSASPVASAEWMLLGPISSAERERVRHLMAIAAKAITNETDADNFTSGRDMEELLRSREWFYADARGERLLREQVDLGAQIHATKVIANAKAQNGGELPNDFQKGKDDGLAATLILGNIACNLQTYLFGDRKSVEQRRNFHVVKSVPDWCTERGGPSVGGLRGGDSYFDGATGGFYGAPVRVARDPRFRPQLKEGIKVKPEEEWKHRHEMYGRRII